MARTSLSLFALPVTNTGYDLEDIFNKLWQGVQTENILILYDTIGLDIADPKLSARVKFNATRLASTADLYCII